MTKTLFRKGDVVTFTGTVRYDGSHDGKIFLTYGEGDVDYCLVPADKLTLTRGKIEVGDRVAVGDGSYGDHYDVVMVEGGQFVARNTRDGRLSAQEIRTHDWQRLTPVDEIAEIAASMGETKRLQEERAPAKADDDEIVF